MLIHPLVSDLSGTVQTFEQGLRVIWNVLSSDDPVGIIIVIPPSSGQMATVSGQSNICISAQETTEFRLHQNFCESTGHLGSWCRVAPTEHIFPFSQSVKASSEELKKIRMKKKEEERTEEAGITTSLCSEHRSLELADVLLEDAYWCFQQPVLRLKNISHIP